MLTICGFGLANCYDIMDLAGAIADDYQLLVYSTGDGPYEIEILYNDEQNRMNNSVIDGTAQAGTTTAYEIQVASGEVNAQALRKISISSSADVINTESSSTITVKIVEGNNIPLQNQQISFNATLGTIPDSAYTDEDGNATVEFTSGQDVGTSRITAQADSIGSFIDVIINNENLPTTPLPSYGGGFGLGVLILILAVGGISLFVMKNQAKKKYRLPNELRRAILVDTAGRQINVTSTNYTIGRLSNCSFYLNDRTVSRLHARIRHAQDHWFIQDMGSSGGTYVNGAPVSAAMLKNGDRIRIGKTEFIFRS